MYHSESGSEQCTEEEKMHACPILGSVFGQLNEIIIGVCVNAEQLQDRTNDQFPEYLETKYRENANDNTFVTR
jgi:hypothetical protein